MTAFRGILGQLLTDLTVDLISGRNSRKRVAWVVVTHTHTLGLHVL